MDSEAADRTGKPWRRVALVAFGVGAGAAATLLLCSGLWFWYVSRPVPWDTKALTASDANTEVWRTIPSFDDFLKSQKASGPTKSSGAPPETLPSDFFDKYGTVTGSPKPLPPLPPGFKLDPRETSFELTVNLQNNTSRDLTIPKGVTIMKRNAQTKALETASEWRWDGEPFIPAKQKVKVSISLRLHCHEETLDSCLGENYKRGDNLVIFDHADRLQIEVPIPIPKQR